MVEYKIYIYIYLLRSGPGGNRRVDRRVCFRDERREYVCVVRGRGALLFAGDPIGRRRWPVARRHGTGVVRTAAKAVGGRGHRRLHVPRSRGHRRPGPAVHDRGDVERRPAGHRVGRVRRVERARQPVHPGGRLRARRARRASGADARLVAAAGPSVPIRRGLRGRVARRPDGFPQVFLRRRQPVQVRFGTRATNTAGRTRQTRRRRVLLRRPRVVASTRVPLPFISFPNTRCLCEVDAPVPRPGLVHVYGRPPRVHRPMAAERRTKPATSAKRQRI